MRVNLYSALAVIGAVAVSATPLLRSRGLSFDYSGQKVRGVNLGGWFVLEPFITPSLFQNLDSSVVDEYTFSQALGRDAAQSALSNHWNTWITQADFQAIAAAGLNHVRIPIGYWAVAPIDGEPYVQGQTTVLDQAIGWARAAGLKVWIDLHGAPGSQNGFDNSGRKGPIDWTQGNTITQTHTALVALAQRYASATDVVTAIELLNEPMGPSLNLGTIQQFYMDGWGNVRDSNADTAVVIHDAFEDVTTWNGFMSQGWNDVILDTHVYQIFTQDLVSQGPSSHVSIACNFGSSKLRGLDKWTVVGEWTGAQTDCAQWLNGRGTGARYDGSFAGSSYVGSCAGKSSGSVDALSGDDKNNLRSFIEAQLDAYEQAQGWIFWTWKTESAPEWNLQQLISGGLFPQPITSRQHPGQCGY